MTSSMLQCHLSTAECVPAPAIMLCKVSPALESTAGLRRCPVESSMPRKAVRYASWMAGSASLALLIRCVASWSTRMLMRVSSPRFSAALCRTCRAYSIQSISGFCLQLSGTDLVHSTASSELLYGQRTNTAQYSKLLWWQRTNTDQYVAEAADAVIHNISTGKWLVQP